MSHDLAPPPMFPESDLSGRQLFSEGDVIRVYAEPGDAPEGAGRRLVMTLSRDEFRDWLEEHRIPATLDRSPDED